VNVACLRWQCCGDLAVRLDKRPQLLLYDNMWQSEMGNLDVEIIIIEGKGNKLKLQLFII
jgi:hypothetical protein